MSESIIFYFFAFFAIASSVAMILSRKAITSAANLVVVFFTLAAIFALRQAHLIAALQVLVYAGAIMVLFVFVIMLLNLEEKKGLRSGRAILAQMLVIGIVCALIGSVAGLFDPLLAGRLASEPSAGFGTAKGVGLLMFTRNLLPFEIISALLLAALIGAVVLTKRTIERE